MPSSTSSEYDHLIKFLMVTGHDINLQDAQHKTALMMLVHS